MINFMAGMTVADKVFEYKMRIHDRGWHLFPMEHMKALFDDWYIDDHIMKLEIGQELKSEFRVIRRVL